MGAARVHLPGLLLAAAGAAVAMLVARTAAQVSAIPVAVALGIIAGNTPVTFDRARAGLAVAARRILRLGVVLLGFRLVVGDLLVLGPATLALVLVVVVGTFFGVQALARMLGLGRDLALLTGAGFAICGASAIAAVQGTLSADEEDVTAALGLVLAFGTVSIVALPLVGHGLGLSDVVAGAWIGAAVHDVGQTVAAAEVFGGTALTTTIVVKLARVLLLAPLVVGVALSVRRRPHDTAERAPLVPLFVVGFVVAVLVRSLEVVPAAVVDGIGAAERVCFAMALFALGTQVRASRLRALGPRPVALGLLAWVVVAAAALAGSVAVVGRLGP